MTIIGKRLSLDASILLGLLLGVVTGLFLGEKVAGLSLLGDIYVGLLQMTVLPYITFSIIANIGGLPAGISGRLAKALALFLLLSWLAALTAVTLLPQVLPPLQSASFFSTSLLEPAPALDFVDLFIPSNFFHSLSNNLVPAVVLFCLCLGAALMTIPDRDRIVTTLNQLTEALGRVNSFLVRLAPYGVFAIAAATAGTMHPEEFQRLQVYLLIYTLGALLLGLVVFPGLISSLTPLSWGEVMRAVRAPMLTAFATGKVFVVLPMLIEQMKQMFDQHPELQEKDSRFLKAIVPMVYSFPHAGKLLSLMFVPFTGWFVDQPLAPWQYPNFLATGLLSFFGSPLAAMPFLLDLHKLPADMFQLFVVSGLYAARLGDALGAIHILFVAALTTGMVHGWLRIKKRRLTAFVGFSLGLWLVVLVGTHTVLQESIHDSYSEDSRLTTMESSVRPVDANVLREAPEPDPERAALPVLERLERYGVLRVGYQSGNLPFTFFNEEGHLVGLDVDAAHRLAEDLGVGLEFVPAHYDKVADELTAGTYDLMMSGAVVLPHRLTGMNFSEPYMMLTAGLLVPDHSRGEMTRRMENGLYQGLRLGVPMMGTELGIFDRILPGTERVHVSNIKHYLDSGGAGLDGCLWSVETGAAWTLIYPAFSVVPITPRSRVPVAYPVALGQEEFLTVLDRWLMIFDATGEKQRLYDYWILGRGSESRTPRWCFMRDVLHWVE